MRDRQAGLQGEFSRSNHRWFALAFGMIAAFFCSHAAMASGYNLPIENRMKFPSHKAVSRG
jgi:hypothetical protein